MRCWQRPLEACVSLCWSRQRKETCRGCWWLQTILWQNCIDSGVTSMLTCIVAAVHLTYAIREFIFSSTDNSLYLLLFLQQLFTWMWISQCFLGFSAPLLTLMNFKWPVVLVVIQPTVSKHWKERQRIDDNFSSITWPDHPSFVGGLPSVDYDWLHST